VEPARSTTLPVAFSTGVVAVAGSAIIQTTNLDTTTTESHNTLPYNSLLRLHPAFAERLLYLRKSAPSTCCDARDTTLRPQPPINTTLGSALTPTALPVLLESRLHAIIYERPLDHIFDNLCLRAEKNPSGTHSGYAQRTISQHTVDKRTATGRHRHAQGDRRDKGGRRARRAWSGDARQAEYGRSEQHRWVARL